MQRQATDRCVGTGDGEIVHQLGPACKLDGLDDAKAAAGCQHLVARKQGAGRDPLAFGRVERVLGRGFDHLAVDGQQDDDRVLVDDDGWDGSLTGRLVVGKDRSRTCSVYQ